MISIQYINSDSKNFGKGSDTIGGFFPLGQIEKSSRIIYFEGVSDTISGFESIDDCYCLNCFSVYNVKNVLKIFSEKYPDKEHIVATDNGEAGIKQGNNAAYEHHAKIAIPPIPDSDWNDFYRQNGVEATKIAFENAIADPQKIVSHADIKLAKNCELRSAVENVCTSFEKMNPGAFKSAKEMALKELNESHADSPFLKECLEQIEAITEPKEYAEIEKRLSDYLRFESACDDSVEIHEDDLINGKYLPAKKIVPIILKNDIFKSTEPHAYCVQSPLGSGKTTIIKELIAILDDDTKKFTVRMQSRRGFFI
ncbi:conserved hypothetical protein [Beggiatoa sp. PS]|nr:conserved hypothetical protein [Beggiatoa sp. PS]